MFINYPWPVLLSRETLNRVPDFFQIISEYSTHLTFKITIDLRCEKRNKIQDRKSA